LAYSFFVVFVIRLALPGIPGNEPGERNIPVPRNSRKLENSQK